MYRRIKKSTPILVVGAALGFFCWPYVDARSPRPKEVDSTSALKSLVASLSPPEAAAPQRDPFDSRTTARPGKRKADTAKKTPAPTGTPGKTSTPAVESLQTASVPATAAADTSAPRGPGDLALQATHLRGDRRVALINGSVYSEGDEIQPHGPAATAYTVNRIYLHRVVLAGESQTLELNYPTHDVKLKSGSRGMAHDNPQQRNIAGTNPLRTD
jgi:hypothetical protein